jgi:hypothetical protein
VDGGHGSAFGVEQRDAADAAGWTKDDRPCYIIALEVGWIPMNHFMGMLICHSRLLWSETANAA